MRAVFADASQRAAGDGADVERFGICFAGGRMNVESMGDAYWRRMRVDDRNLNGAAGLQPGRPSEPDAGARIHVGRAESGVRRVATARRSLASPGPFPEAMTAHAAERAQRVGKLAAEYRAGQYNVECAIGRPSAVVRDALERKDARAIEGSATAARHAREQLPADQPLLCASSTPWCVKRERRSSNSH